MRLPVSLFEPSQANSAIGTGRPATSCSRLVESPVTSGRTNCTRHSPVVPDAAGGHTVGLRVERLDMVHTVGQRLGRRTRLAFPAPKIHRFLGTAHEEVRPVHGVGEARRELYREAIRKGSGRIDRARVVGRHGARHPGAPQPPQAVGTLRRIVPGHPDREGAAVVDPPGPDAVDGGRELARLQDHLPHQREVIALDARPGAVVGSAGQRTVAAHGVDDITHPGVSAGARLRM